MLAAGDARQHLLLAARTVASAGLTPSVDGILRVTPAIEGGIADHVWSIEEIVNLPA